MVGDSIYKIDNKTFFCINSVIYTEFFMTLLVKFVFVDVINVFTIHAHEILRREPQDFRTQADEPHSTSVNAQYNDFPNIMYKPTVLRYKIVC